MLHNEARELLVKGYEKSGDVKATAAAYSVSERTAYRLVEQKRETGSVALRTSQRGRKPALTEENKENIRKRMDEKPDSTVEELREELGVKASYSTAERAIWPLGYTLKKKTLHASERERLRCAGEEETVEGKHHGRDGRTSGISG